VAELWLECSPSAYLTDTQLSRLKRIPEYLKAAGLAVRGLEIDYDDILDQSEVCMMSSLNDVVALQTHVLRHLNQDRFLSILEDSHQGPMNCWTSLQAQTEKIFFRIKIKAERENAMADLISTLKSLEKYMKKLHDGTKDRSTRSGVGVKWLIGIESRLNDALAAHRAQQLDVDKLRTLQNDFVAYIKKARNDRSKDALHDSIRDVRRTIEETFGAFR
jgi:hypothetical protein